MIKEIENQSDYETAVSESNKSKVFLMKHSNACGRSDSVLNDEFEKFYEKNSSVPCYLLTIQKHREISDLIARETGIKHHSPQVLVFDRGRVVESYIHWDITSDALVGALERA